MNNKVIDMPEQYKVAWVPDNNHYFADAIESVGGNFVETPSDITEADAKNLAAKLSLETQDAAGQYIVAYERG